MKDTKDILSLAAGRAVISQPFFATFILGATRIKDPTIPTACTDGKVIRYNPSFINKLYDDHGYKGVSTLLMHEAAHIFLLHNLRRGSRDPFKWNIAADHVINNMLLSCIKDSKDSCMCEIPGWVCDTEYAAYSTEQVYDMLPDDEVEKMRKQVDGGEIAGMLGDVSDLRNADGTPLSEAQKQQMEQDVQARIRATLSRIKKQAGKVPAIFSTLVDDLFPARNNWREILSRFVGGTSKKGFSWSHPSRRHLHYGTYLPSLHSPDFLPVAFAIDTSGSVSLDEVKLAVSEVVDAVSCFQQDITIPVIYCDTEVGGVEMVSPGDDVLRPVGGGGTDYEPVMRYISDGKLETEVHALIYQTDGYCTSFGADPGVPVLWILAGDHIEPSKFNPPFGEVIVLE